MKRIFLSLALIGALTFSLQAKDIESAKEDVQSALENTKKPKKAAKAKTWVKLAHKYIEAYKAVRGEAQRNLARTEIALLYRDTPVISSEEFVSFGEKCVKDIYDRVTIYYTAEGSLIGVEVTKPAVDNALDLAFEAYNKAKEVEPGKSTSDIEHGLKELEEIYNELALVYYYKGDNIAASKTFEMKAIVSETAPLSKIDSASIYNAGTLAVMVNDLERGEKLLERCVSLGYLGEGGELYGKLGDLYRQQGKNEKAKEVLEKGFLAYPNSQGILFSLINFYLTTGTDSAKLIDLIKQAQQKDPNNISLWDIEANTYEKLGDKEKAFATYDKIIEMKPDYAMAYIRKGIFKYNIALELQDKANAELDDAKYMALTKEFEQILKECIPIFEKAFELNTDPKVAVGVAEYLKNCYFRFREESPEMQKNYEKYDAIVKADK